MLGRAEVSRSIGKFSCSYQLHVQEQQARAAATQARAAASTERWESHAWWSGASSSSAGWAAAEPNMGWNTWREAHPGAPRRSQLAEALREQEKQRRWEAQHVCPFVLLYVSERLMFVSSRRFVFLMAVQHRHIFTVIVVVVRGLGANRSSAACVECSNHRMHCMKISASRRALMILSTGSAGSASSRICDSDG